MVADVDSADVGSDGVDDAARVRAENPGRGDGYPRKSLDDEQIESVERPSANAEADIARPLELGHRKVVAELETIEAAVTGDRECLHEVSAEAVILRPLGKLAGSCGLLGATEKQVLRLLRNHQDDILRRFTTIEDDTSDSEFTRMISIKVPTLGESIVEATVSRWLKKEGEAVAVGDTLVELETDKITVEVTAMNAGVVKKIAHGEGDVVKVDELLAEIDDTATAAAPASAPAPTTKPPASAPAASPQAPQAAPQPVASAKAAAPPPPPSPAPAEVRASPGAQRVAAERGIDLSTVPGTGRGGVVSKPDVIEHGTPEAKPERVEFVRVKEPLAAPVPGSAPANGRETREKMTTRRKRIAEHLLESQHATAHLTTFNEIDMSAVIAVRERLKERVEKEQGVKLSFMPFFVKAACMALKTYPVVNAQIDGDSIIYKHYVNMGIAVASDAGLVVPNVKDADRKGMLDVSREIAAVAKRARDGKLTMDDLTGGTFTITNGGVFGSLVSTPIINFPQVGILGLHKTQDRPIAIAGKVEIRPMMYVALSYDHRVIDGQQAVLFLVRVKELMEDPASMLID